MTLLYTCIRNHFSSLLGPYGTISHGPFLPDFSEKRSRAQRPSVWIVTRGSASEQWEPKRPGDVHPAVSIRNHWRRLRRGWSPVPARVVTGITVKRSERTSELFTSVCYEVWVSEVNVHDFCLVDSTSTVDIDWFVFGMNPYRLSIFTDFWLKSTVDQISTVFSSRWILIDRRYRPYSQVGESLSTVNIDRIFK